MRFEEFVIKQKDFLYINRDVALFGSSKKIDGTNKIGLKLLTNGNFYFGCIKGKGEDKYFERGKKDEFFPSEIKWIIEKLSMIEEYDKTRKKKLFEKWGNKK